MKKRDVMGSGLGSGLDDSHPLPDEKPRPPARKRETVPPVVAVQEKPVPRQKTLEERVKAIEDFLWGEK